MGIVRHQFDLVVVTAANKAQADGYRASLAGRKNFLVVADPGGRRVGSLGATVNVLRRLAPGYRRVLVCHSGGDAKRTPAYAAMGKAFIPMRDSRPILDHIVDEMEKLPAADGVVVCCGDVVAYLDAGKVRFDAAGVTGVAYPDGPWQARRHGVYEAEKANGCSRVVGFRQKPAVKKGRFLIDTGIMHIGWPVAEKMKALPAKGDIYEDFPGMLLGGFAPFKVSVVPRCRFFHVGSSRELLDRLGSSGKLVDCVRAPIESLEGGNIVTNVPAEYGTVRLRRGECLTSMPLEGGGWYHLKYGLKDSFKEDGLWEKHSLGEIMRKVDHSRLLKLRSDKGEITVEKPLRIDLAGGWSDTPPICYEMGGCVLNAAVTLNGVRPVKVKVRVIDAKEVRIRSVDLQKSGVIRTMREIRAPKDPHDWSALVKSALTVIGYDFTWGGLEIKMSADVPKGSGMGTSSILGCALIEALMKLRGKSSWREIAQKTLELEQEMKTGGGWEDQVGALVPGVKLIETGPGEKQVFRVRRLSAEAERAFARFLKKRALLYFTGQKRMARNVLFGVLDFYRQNPDGIAVEIVKRLKADALKAFKAIGRGDWDSYTAAVNGYWLSKKALDPGSTNQFVESIMARMAPWTEAASLCGAGGGGFMLVIARNAESKRRILKVFDGKRKFAAGRFYDFDID